MLEQPFCILSRSPIICLFCLSLPHTTLIAHFIRAAPSAQTYHILSLCDLSLGSLALSLSFVFFIVSLSILSLPLSLHVFLTFCLAIYPFYLYHYLCCDLHIAAQIIIFCYHFISLIFKFICYSFKAFIFTYLSKLIFIVIFFFSFIKFTVYINY